MIYEDLKRNMLIARKARNNADTVFLSYVIGAIENSGKGEVTDNGKSYSDETCIAILKNLRKKCEEAGDTQATRNEIATIDLFLPKQLSRVDIESIFDYNNLKSIPERMKFLKENYFGQYDGKLAATIAKEY